jgi:DNA-binding NarL/FixJ family response regulator
MVAHRVRIVIADRHSIFRDGLRRLLETDSGLEIVGESVGGPAAATLTQETRADILLLSLPASDPAMLATLALLADGSGVRTILLTDGIDSPHVTRALQLGVRGVVPRDSVPEALFGSIHGVMAGDFWIGRDRAEDVAPSLRKLALSRRRARVFGLTRRELDILRSVVAGCTNKEIASRSSISENTVKSHLVHIFNTVGAWNRVELALFASHHRILDGV